MLLAQWGQAFAEAAGAIGCVIAARHVVGQARWTWSLFAAGLTIWAVTDLAYGATTALAGVSVPEVSVFDVGWLLFYLPMLAGVVLLYDGLRPERGWQGALDGVLLVLVLVLLTWALVLQPVASQGPGGSLSGAVDLAYPALDLMGLAALSWVLLRDPMRAPRWLWLVAGALGLQFVGGLVYLGGWISELPPAGWLSPVTYMAAGGLWCAAGLVRRADPVRKYAASERSRPPIWSRAIPFVLVGVMMIFLLPRDGLAGIVGLTGLAIVGARLVSSMRINARLLAERDRLLSSDTLTGAYNRRYLAEELPRAFARSARSGEPLAVIAFDLDRFKEVNDRFGHSAGDELLCAVVDGVRSCLRLGDVLCRLGGDEFVALLPGADAWTAREVSLRILATSREAGHRWAVDTSASLGIATFPEHASGADELLRAADEAMYRAKGEGRDRVVIAPAPTPPAPAPPAAAGDRRSAAATTLAAAPARR